MLCICTSTHLHSDNGPATRVWKFAAGLLATNNFELSRAPRLGDPQTTMGTAQATMSTQLLLLVVAVCR